MAPPKRWINVTDPGWTFCRSLPRVTAWLHVILRDRGADDRMDLSRSGPVKPPSSTATAWAPTPPTSCGTPSRLPPSGEGGGLRYAPPRRGHGGLRGVSPTLLCSARGRASLRGERRTGPRRSGLPGSSSLRWRRVDRWRAGQGQWQAGVGRETTPTRAWRRYG